ncbi:hypothetical protein [Pedobacter nutrimenti]|uniref:Uncharacterized protein n=1 Tax=Pedobacter nutrimenti TaxID=1241337 RepID=A0A318UFW9_9SPHI|nr:hypothetical protein [Pedobacter nutrimenti]PYF74380.1 hypothetical protein B0O44_104551 [Pedobacter nutrimenti]
MKKVFFTFLLFTITVVLSFAQTSPTKQETMDWIVAKLRENGYGTTQTTVTGDLYLYRFNYTVDDNGIINVEENSSVKDESGRSYTKDSYSFSLNDICSIQTGNAIKCLLKTKIDLSTELNQNGYKSRINRLRQYSFICLTWGKEQNLNERMTKALQTLAEYNCPKAKNTF